MIDLSDKYALAALKERRAAIAIEITSLESRLRYLREMVEHVNGTIRLFGSDPDPNSIPERKPYRQIRVVEAGELNRLILTALREARRPLSTGEVTNAVIKALGYDPGVVQGMTNRVEANLIYLTQERWIVAKQGDGIAIQWEISKSWTGSWARL